MTLAPFQGRVIFKKKEYTLPAVPLGSLVPVSFPIEMHNVGSTKVSYSINKDEITCEEHNDQIGQIAKIFDIMNPEENIDSQRKHFIYCVFKPFEAKLYTFHLRIKVRDFEKEVQPPIELKIQGRGYARIPPKEEIVKKGEIPSQRSQVSVLGSKVFFSIEEIDFGVMEPMQYEHRLIILYNSNHNQRLLFDFKIPKLIW